MDAVEHRQIVLVVADGECPLRPHAKQAAQFAQGRALVVVGMAQAQIDRIALIGKFRHLRPERVQPRDDAIHFLVVLRDQPRQIPAVLQRAGVTTITKLGLRLAFHECGEFLEQRRGVGKKLAVPLCANRVPIAVILPAMAIRRGTIHLPFEGDGEVGLHRQVERLDPIVEPRQAAPGVDRPAHAARAQCRENFHQQRRERRGIAVLDERAVEVGADEQNGRGRGGHGQRRGAKGGKGGTI